MSQDIHSILKRQLKKHGVDLYALPENLTSLIAAVNTAYYQADTDRNMIERSLQLSSTELLEQNREMRATLEMFPEILEKLGPIHNKSNFRELLIQHVEEIKSSRNRIIQQADLLRTQAIELETARDIAIQSSKSKSEFLANMSHEIRTPMNGILGMLHVVLNSNLAEDQRQYLEMAEQSTHSLLSLLNDILDVSKIEAGKLEMEFMPFDLRETIKIAAQTFSLQAEEKQLEFFCWVDPNIPESFLGDSHRLRQVIVNLLNNAIKFTEQGSVILRVTKQTSALTDEFRLEFSIEDTGPGIPEDKKEVIFSAFQQVDGSISRRFGGTGLGLTISTQLVKMMGGELKLESELGKGSRFYFTLQSPHISETISEKTSVFTGGKQALSIQNEFDSIIVLSSSNLIISYLDLVFATTWKESKTVLPVSDLRSLEIKTQQELSRIIIIVDHTSCKNISGSDLIFLEKIKNCGAKILNIFPVYKQQSPQQKSININQSLLLTPFTDVELLVAIQRLFIEENPEELANSSKSKDTQATLGLKIIVVDDIAINRTVAQKLIELQGHQATTLTSGEELLDLLGITDCAVPNELPCDLILLDIQMPGLNGMETARQIRKAADNLASSNPLRTVPIVALTAHALKGDRELFLEAGMDDYLSKTIDSETLSFIINKLCAEKKRGLLWKIKAP